MDSDHDVVNVCAYYYTDSEEEASNIIKNVESAYFPDFLKNKSININFSDITESKIVASTGEPSSVGDGDRRSEDTLQVEVFSDSEREEEFAVHTHLVANEHKSDMWDAYSSILNLMGTKELAIISTESIVDSNLEELEISELATESVHEDAALENIVFSIDECKIGVSEYFGGTVIQAYTDEDHKEMTTDEILKRVNSFPDVDVNEVVR